MPSSETGSEGSASSAKDELERTSFESPSVERPAASVRDFLYHDARRIASFLAQFQTYGVAHAIRSTESVRESRSQETIAGADVGVPALIKGSTTLGNATSIEEGDAAEHTFDPLWTNAQSLLQYLTERGMIVPKIYRAYIGQFVLVSGKLSIFDLSIAREFWKGSPIKSAFVQEMKKQNSAQASSSNRPGRPAAPPPKKSAFDDPEVGLALLSVLPHTIQCTLRMPATTVWCSLSSESMVVSSSDILLKHGVSIAGEWSILGILDATPQSSNAHDQITGALSLGLLSGQLASQVGVPAQLFLGRPSSAYGITPLLIFREVYAARDDQLSPSPFSFVTSPLPPDSSASR